MNKPYARGLGRMLYPAMVIAGIGLFSTVAPASAAEFEPGFYLSFGLGQFNEDSNNTNITAARSSNTSHRYGVGYMFNDYLGVEGGYVAFRPVDFNNNVTGGTQSFKAHTEYVSAIGQFPISKKEQEMVSLYAEGGFHRWGAEERNYNSSKVTTTITQKTGTKSSLGYGALIRGKNAAFRAGYDKYLGIAGSGTTEHDFSMYHIDFLLYL